MVTTERRLRVDYVTSSVHKREENQILQKAVSLSNGSLIGDVVDFHIREVPISELLEVDLQVMVQAEVVEAYNQIRVPCIVEHAGLVFDEYKSASYPGGLTKPMWNALGDRFIQETQSAGRRAIARAVVAYCDGKSVRTFVGETLGTLAETPRGAREFYWDTVFVPDGTSGAAAGLTYAEIVEHDDYGLEYKVRELSQSTKAMVAFLETRISEGPPDLWPDGP